jgi:hypothetical protein
MSIGPEDPNYKPDEAVVSPKTVVRDEAVACQSDASSIEAVAHDESREPKVAPAAFMRLKEYCDGHGLKSTIDLTEPFENINVELQNGRFFRTVYIGTEDAASALLKYHLEDLVFLGSYSAICSCKEGWIEAAVRQHGSLPPIFPGVSLRNIFGATALRGGDPADIEIPAGGGPTLRLTEKRGILWLLDYGSPFYVRIEGIVLNEHDKALKLLEELTNSLFLQIDFRFDVPLTLGRESFRLRNRFRSSGQLDEDPHVAYPRYSYEGTPSSLYWYARSAQGMPLLQFLAFYQCIEFFFPRYSRQETIAKIKNVLKDPAFDGSKDSCINVMLNAILEGRRGSPLPEERKQLGATLKACVDPTALRDFLTETDDRKLYYAKDYKEISDKKISLSDAGLTDQTAERVYDIRCKVVHTKNLDVGEGDEMILPFSTEADLMMEDVELIKFLARKVLIASSVLLKM